MRTAILVAALALAVPAAASAKQGPPPLAATWAPGVEISYTETVTDDLGNVVSQVHRGGIPAGTAFGSAAVAGVKTIADAAPARRLAACCSAGGSDTVSFEVTKRSWLGFVACAVPPGRSLVLVVPADHLPEHRRRLLRRRRHVERELDATTGTAGTTAGPAVGPEGITPTGMAASRTASSSTGASRPRTPTSTCG